MPWHCGIFNADYVWLTHSLEENFAQIHLPNWQFYLPKAIG